MRKVKRGVLIFFALFLISSETHAISPALSAAAVSSAAAARRRQEEHERQYHNGPMTYYVEKEENWSIKKPYVVSYYEIEYYYYQKDPNQCIQKVKKNFIEKRFATEQETYEHDLHIKHFVTIIATLISIFIGTIIGSLIYDKVKEGLIGSLLKTFPSFKKMLKKGE